MNNHISVEVNKALSESNSIWEKELKETIQAKKYE